ncbi:MAG: glycosyltransferase family 2 protein [Alphaproteobacteria bacterium]|nr:glycosyltransferase family 2 protein [Alphaproteobacteria bacterium]
MTPDSTLELSIIMPCLNEARTLPLCLKKARDFLEKHNVKGEIVVADNGSTDDSIKIAQGLGARLVPVARRGYGAALAGGIAAAQGRYVIMGDADDSYDFSALLPILQKLRERIDLVVGNRFKGGVAKGAMPFMNRYVGNPVLSFIGRLFFKIPLGDFHCGLRGFSRRAIVDLDLKTTGMEYASEMIVHAALHHLRIEEVPVTLSPDGRERKPHLRPWRDGWRHLRFLLLYSPRWLYLYPGLGMIGFGLFVALLLLPGPIVIADGVGLDVHTLLVASISILVGLQSITFGVLARAYAQRNGILPASLHYKKLLSEIRLEHFLVLGAGVFLVGVICVMIAVQRWTAVDFGPLTYGIVMRLLIVAATCIVAGFQLGCAAFLLGVMQISHK